MRGTCPEASIGRRSRRTIGADAHIIERVSGAALRVFINIGSCFGQFSAHMDPVEDMVGILMTQRMMDSPTPPKVFRDFWTTAYQAIDD